MAEFVKEFRVKFWQNKESKEKRGDARKSLECSLKCCCFSGGHRADGSRMCSSLRKIGVKWTLLSLSGGGTQRGENIQDNGLWRWRAPLAGSPPFAPAISEHSLPLLLGFDLTHWMFLD